MMIRLIPFAFLFLPGHASALEIRSYSPARHDRFITGANGLEMNPSAYYVASRYAAAGYNTGTTDGRQYPLVTPEHVLFAKHYHTVGTNIRFLNSSGQPFDRTVVSAIQVPNGSGGTADAIILKLNAPIPAETGITPFPYLNLANEAAYNGTVLTTFGKALRAGRGTIAAFSNFTDTGIDSTRTYSFVHFTAAGNQDDAYAVTGDSGSPTFALANNRPALVGLHLAASSGGSIITTVDTFVPHYAATIDGLLAPAGYRLIPGYPVSVSLAAALTNPPLRQAVPADLSIELSNNSGDAATNPNLQLIFPANAIPNSITAPGWIIDNPSIGDYRLRRATLAGNSSAAATISYTPVPVLMQIPVTTVHRSDGSPTIEQTTTLHVAETFAGFVAALPLEGELDDPDHDGVGNLLEYFFGGDPGANSALAVGGYPLAPQVSASGGTLTYTFARRTDEAERGLSHGVEFSETLTAASWTTDTPPGTIISSAPFDPDVPGFGKVTVTVPTNSPEKLFIRLNVSLAE